MKQIILFFLTLAFYNLNAQIEFSPEENTKNDIVDLSDVFNNSFIESFLLNNTSTSVSLKWEIVKIVAPEEWEVQLSVSGDGGGAFSWGGTSNIDVNIGLDIPLPIASIDSSEMRLGLRPKGVAGCGTYEVRVSLTSDTSQVIAIGTYNFMINTPPDCITSDDNFGKAQILIFPNPTSDYFTITENQDIKSIQIFNIVGQQMALTSF
ncbi:MAG: hypothetical protein AB8F94_29385 [Saprospiraceae bacterium]